MSHEQADPDALTGRALGDFVLRERLGEGGFGLVYRAEQPRLQREAVVKVLRPGHGTGSEARQRFVREARLAGQFDHPFAAHIYDSDAEPDGTLWIAMELVRGVPLDRLLRDGGPLPPARFAPFFHRICEVVQSAHERGIVHRDLKPANVMAVEEHGALFPKLLDFGLARLQGEAAELFVPPAPRASPLITPPASRVSPLIEPIGALPEGPISFGLDSALRNGGPQGETGAADLRSDPVRTASLWQQSRLGGTAGTPAYLAPELWSGDAAPGPSSDLYALGLIAWEGLVGKRPFEGDAVALSLAHREAPLPPLPAHLPPALSGFFARALSKRPEERFATALELWRGLEAALGLQRRALSRRALLLLGAVAVVLLITGGAVVTHRLEARRLEACSLGDGRGERAFDPARQRAVEEAFGRSGSAAAAAVFPVARDGLLQNLRSIAAARAEACAATNERGEASAGMLDLRLQCLDERVQDASALVDAFTRADATTVEKAIPAVQQLADAAGCKDRKRLLEASPLPASPEARAQISAAREQVASLAALHGSGRYREGLEKSAAVAEAAQKTGYPPLEAEALYWRGRLLFDGNEQPKAAAVLLAADSAATRARRDDLSARAESQLVHALGWAQKHEEALHWAEHARAVIGRGGDDPLLLSELVLARGYAHSKVMHPLDAIADNLEALSLLERAQGGPALIVPALQALAGAQGMAAQFKPALATDERALPLAEKTFGPLHPMTIAVRSHVGTMLMEVGDYRGALPILERTREDRRAALGPDHLDVARSNGAVAAVLEALGDSAGAQAAYAEATRIVEARLGKDHPELIPNLGLVSEPLARLGRFAEAHAALDRAQSLAKKAQGDKSTMLGFLIEARGTVLEIEGRSAEATHAFEEAAARIERDVPGHPDVASCKSGIARHLRRSGRAKEAAAAHASLLAAAEKRVGPQSRELIDPLSDLAEDLLALGRDQESRALFERALGLLEQEQSDPQAIAEIRFAAARALWTAPSERPRAIGLARQAQAALAAAKLPREPLRADVTKWLLARATDRAAR